MRPLRIAALALACAGFAAQRHAAPFDFNETIRVDYLHTGGPRGERIAMDAVFREGAWSGRRRHLLDDTGLGSHFFQVIDRQSGEAIFSQSFASIYGEWETTPEFNRIDRTFQESLRFPRPMRPVRVVLQRRDRQQNFQTIWTADVNPARARPSPPQNGGRLTTVFENGAPESHVDLLLVGDGYAAEEMAKFRADATRLIEALFSLEPFKRRKSDFNVRTLELAGRRFGVEFNVFGIERYALTFGNRTFRDLLSHVPYDAVEILVNGARYGGGGIYNLQSTVSAGNADSEYVFVHEFAHNLAGLGDEYTGNVTYQTGAPVKVEPWEPNLTAMHDPATLKWRDLVEPGTPLPTPPSFAGKVGAFEGGGYETRGIYRPEAACIMGSRKLQAFCRVCERAIGRILDIQTQ